MLECLENIVGVLKEDTPIITQGLTTQEIAALQVSKSGLFLDQLPGGVHMKALKFADTVKPFSKMAYDALELASQNLEADLIVALNEKYQKSRKSFQGQIGRMSYAGTLSSTARWQGIQIKPVDYINGVATITRMHVILNGAANFTLRLLKVPSGSVMGTEVETWEVNALANQYFTIDLVGDDILKLPLIENGQTVEYWFVYDRNEIPNNVFAKDTKLECSTCEKKSSLGEYVQAWGVGVSDINNLNYKVADNYSRGLIIDIAISCDNNKIFCKEYNDEEAVAVTMAYAVWFHAGELLIEEVLKSPDVNRYTTMAREYLWGKRNHFRGEYQDRVKYLQQTIDVAGSNCFVCKEVSNQPRKGGIFV